MQKCFYVEDQFYRQHQFDLPLNYSDMGGETVNVFAREVVAKDKKDDDLPWLVYLQGGPGFPSPRPSNNSAWLKRILKKNRVLLLDQRGTGSSTVISHQTLASKSPADQGAYLSHFRADNIVREAEATREKLKN